MQRAFLVWGLPALVALVWSVGWYRGRKAEVITGASKVEETIMGRKSTDPFAGNSLVAIRELPSAGNSDLTVPLFGKIRYFDRILEESHKDLFDEYNVTEHPGVLISDESRVEIYTDEAGCVVHVRVNPGSVRVERADYWVLRELEKRGVPIAARRVSAISRTNKEVIRSLLELMIPLGSFDATTESSLTPVEVTVDETWGGLEDLQKGAYPGVMIEKMLPGARNNRIPGEMATQLVDRRNDVYVLLSASGEKGPVWRRVFASGRTERREVIQEAPKSVEDTSD